MNIRIKKAIFHKHILQSSSLLLTHVPLEFDCNNPVDPVEKYLIDLLEFNSKKNLGQLSNFFGTATNNPFLNHTSSAMRDDQIFVDCTRAIMNDLIQPLTPGTSSSGNYLFVLYDIDDEERFFDDNGNLKTAQINELRFALLKFELQDSESISYNTDDPRHIYVTLKIENDGGLPKVKEKIKKGVFVNNLESNCLNYQIRVIDRESSYGAKFFTEKVLIANQVQRISDYLPKMRTVIKKFVQNLESQQLITLEQQAAIIYRFHDYISSNSCVNQTEIGIYLFTDIIEDERIAKYNDLLLTSFHYNGLTHNMFTIIQQDLDKFNKKNYIRFSEEGYLKFSSADVSLGKIKLDEDRDDDGRYKVTIFTDEPPINLVDHKR